MPRVNIIVYNKSEIFKWKEELTRLTEERKILEKNICLMERTLEPLNLELQSIQIQINSHQNDYYREMKFLDIPTEVSSALGTQELLSLREQYDAKDTARRSQQEQKDNYDAMLKEHKSRIDWLNEHIMQAEQFLVNLDRDPESLVVKLTNDILTKFKSYEKEHPIESSSQVRLCLFKIKEKLVALDVGTIRSSSGPSKRHEKQNNACLNYLLLCAFLWQMYHQMEQEEPFAAPLKELLETTHILEHGDLPDEFSIGRGIDGYLSVIEQQNGAIFNKNTERLLKLERTLLIQKISDTKLKLQQRSSLHGYIDSAIDLIEEKALNVNKCERFDYYFYNCLLDRFEEVLANPFNQEAGKNVGKLAELTSGKPSFTKKLKGILLTVGGIVVLLGFLAATLVFIPGAPFLFPISLALQCKIGIGIGFSLGVLTGTGLSFWGLKTFSGGTRQGLSRLCKEIERSIPCTIPENKGVFA